MSVYTMSDIKQISNNIEIDLPKEVINIINFLASKVGAPSYKKTPNFNKKRGHYNKGNNDKITADDWTAIRNSPDENTGPMESTSILRR